MTSQHAYLVGLHLSGKKVVVVGAGSVAQRRLPLLIASGADVHVVSPAATPVVEALVDNPDGTGITLTSYYKLHSIFDARGNFNGDFFILPDLAVSVTFLARFFKLRTRAAALRTRRLQYKKALSLSDCA